MERESLIVAALLGALIVIRLWLAAKFKRDWRGRRIAVTTAQLLVVVAAVIAHDHFGQEHGLLILGIAVLAVVCLSFIPARPVVRDARNP